MNVHIFLPTMPGDITGKTDRLSWLWRALCIAVLVCTASCSSKKPETAGTMEQTGGSTVAKPSETAGQPNSGGLSPIIESEGARGAEELSRNEPKVVKGGFRIENMNGMDVLKVVAEGSNKNGDNVSLRFQWTKNGEPAGDGDTISGFKRGDKIAVKITPFDDQGDGLPKSLTTEIINTPPRIVEHQQTNFDGKVWSYQVKATDADGDPLTYSLKAAPQGMTINSTTGFIKWEVPPEFTGKAPVTVSVTDGHGGEATYNFEVIINAGPGK